MLLAALDQTIVATALPTIGRELHDLEHLSWVVTAYLLTGTAVTPLYGKYSDIRGRRAALTLAEELWRAARPARARVRLQERPALAPRLRPGALLLLVRLPPTAWRLATPAWASGCECLVSPTRALSR